jgi:trimeric autotransporter adhesin
MSFTRCLYKWIFAISILGSFVTFAQKPSLVDAAVVVPRLVNFSGKAVDGGKVVAGVTGATFAIYSEETGGSPLWLETQNIQADAKGNYTVQLGATKPEGLPLDLFTSASARWLGVTINGGQEQPRILLLSVPYALKAADAETVGGLPASAFVLAASSGATTNNSMPNLASSAKLNGISTSGQPTSSTANASSRASSDVTTTGGTVNTLPLFTTGTNIQNSSISQTGSGTTAKIGINTTAPAVALDVHGGTMVRGTLTLPASGTATATAGKNSDPLNFVASVYNTSTKAAGSQTFQWQAEPSGNNTTTPSGTMNLLFGSGTAAPAETGVSITNSGLVAAKVLSITGGGSLEEGSSYSIVSGNPLSGNFALSAWVSSEENNGVGLFGVSDDNGYEAYGVVGEASYSNGNATGVYGIADASTAYGVFGQAGGNLGGMSVTGGNLQSNLSAGVGTWGDGGTAAGSVGVAGTVDDGNAGVFENNTSSYDTVLIDGLTGPNYPLAVVGASGSCLFDSAGDLICDGAIDGASKHFRIDHPLDPANKFFSHASVESSEMLNIYSGTAPVDASGSAVVSLPDWFEAVNEDFRYQLTAIGAPAPNLYIAQEISNHQFTIGGGQPGMKVSWQVTAVRHDAWAKAHPLEVSTEKGAAERGYYIHPELYGQTKDRSLATAHVRGQKLPAAINPSAKRRVVRPNVPKPTSARLQAAK